MKSQPSSSNGAKSNQHWAKLKHQEVYSKKESNQWSRMFGDSSQDMFSAVTFLRGQVTTDNSTNIELAFVFGKARVRPMKALTNPYLELQNVTASKRHSKCPHDKGRQNIPLD